MGHYADHLKTVDETFSSPDGRIKARLRKNTNLTLAFLPGTYRKYDDRSLERQLTALVTKLYEVRRRIHIDAMSAGLLVTAGRRAEVGRNRPTDAKARRFEELHAQLDSHGVSPNRSVRIFNTGMRGWQVRIVDGTVDRTGEDVLAREFVAAVSTLVVDYRTKLAGLKHKVFGEPGSQQTKRVTT